MEKLLDLSFTQLAVYAGFLTITTLCILALARMLVFVISKLHLQKLETKAGSVTFTSPNDSMSLHAMDDDETSQVSLDKADWSRHPYFNLLSNLKTKGVKVVCSSDIKAQFINGYMKVYAQTLYDELLKWIDAVIKSDGKELANIMTTMNNIESLSQDKLKSSRVEIHYKDVSMMVPLPNILIDRFTESYSLTQSAVFETLEMPLDSKFYDGWQDQLNCILGQMYTITSMNFVGMNCAVKNLNGELDHYFADYARKLNKEYLIADYFTNVQ